MTYKKAVPIFVLTLLVMFAGSGRVFAATTTVTLEADWDEGTCMGTVNGSTGVVQYAVAEGDTLQVVVKNVSSSAVSVVYAPASGAGTTRTIAAGASDTQTLTNFKDSFEVSPAPIGTGCPSSSKAYALLYADPPPYTAAASLPPSIVSRQAAGGSAAPISFSGTASIPEEQAQTSAPDPAAQVYGDPVVTETHAGAAKVVGRPSIGLWQMLAAPLLLFGVVCVVGVLRWRALLAVREYNRPMKRRAKRR